MIVDTAGSLLLVTFEGGVVHVPFTLYLNERYLNPSTRISAARALRVLFRLVDAFDIDFAARALKALCFSEAEKKCLVQLAWQSIKSIESMSKSDVRNIASAKSKTSTAKIKGAVGANTAAKHLIQIAEFLAWYHDKVLSPRMPLTSGATDALRREFESCVKDLKQAIGGTKSMHPHKIKSVPSRRFLEIYSAVFLRPEEVLTTDAGKMGHNLIRDRAMLLLAAEGLRPGAIGNIALNDFKWPGGNERGYIAIKDNTARRSKQMSIATPRQKGITSRQSYNSELVVAIWPTTAQAIHDYIDRERQAVTARTLRNKSEGFLFLADHGGPIGDRATITKVFRRAGLGLQRLGLLAKERSDPYLNGESYSFTAYLLRHSAASLFYSSKAMQMKGEVVEDLMKMRFGWAAQSAMPRLYAQRAMSDAASLTVDDFVDSLLMESRANKPPGNRDADHV